MKKRLALLGASGYTGADFLRLGLNHPGIDFVALSAERQAGKQVDDLWPHLQAHTLPVMQSVDDIDFKGLNLDAVVTCLPHATTHAVLTKILADTDHILLGGSGADFKIIDLSADFRLRDTNTYAEWYGGDHALPDLQPMATYGLTELYRDQIKQSGLVACPGCYPTAALLTLLPLIKAGVIQTEGIHIDAKSGVTGAGRGLKEANLFAEVAEAMHPYGLGGHRHTPEIEQEIAAFAGEVPEQVRVQFVPHLIPINRGELVTITAKLSDSEDVSTARAVLKDTYDDETFVHLLPEGRAPQTRMVRGSNTCVLNAFEARAPGRIILVAAIDNLVKGSSGQAMQNFNLMMGFEEGTALQQVAMFP